MKLANAKWLNFQMAKLLNEGKASVRAEVGLGMGRGGERIVCKTSEKYENILIVAEPILWHQIRSNVASSGRCRNYGRYGFFGCPAGYCLVLYNRRGNYEIINSASSA